MKIMHLLKHAQRGNGHVHVAVDLACAQADADHAVVLAGARGSYDALLTAHGVRVIDLPEPVDAHRAVSALRAIWRLTLAERPDIIHAHMMSSAVLAYPAAKAVGAALVTTVHNSFDRHSGLMRLGDVVVAVSEAEREHLLARRFPPRKVVAVLNGAGRSPRETLPFDDIGPLHTPAVVSLCGMHPRKAVQDIITAFAEVSTEFPDWHLALIGGGPDRPRLERQASELGLEASVHFMGSTLTPRPLLEQAQIFVSASLADPCPLTVTEARSAGCAIVATAVGGVPEVLSHGEAGWLVPASDPAAIAHALRELMASPELLATWRARAASGAEHFTVERVADDYERVYRMASARRRTSRRPRGAMQTVDSAHSPDRQRAAGH